MAKFQLGQKSEDILSLGVRRLSQFSLAEQKKMLRQLFQTANRRLTSLEKCELTPTALRHVQTSGLKRFSIAVTEKELHREYAVLQDFFAQKSSTVAGAKSIEKEFFKIKALQATRTPTSPADLTEEQQKKLYEEYGGRLTEEAMEQFGKENIAHYWDVFHQILERNPNYNNSQGSPTVREKYEQEYDPNKSADEIREAVESRLAAEERGEIQRARGRRDVFSAGRNSF